MFIPRTLAETERRLTQGTFARALGVTILLAAALTGILTLNVAPGAVSLKVGEIAPQDIRAARRVSFVSDSLTQAKRDQAANAVQPIYVQIRPPGDIRQEQLASYGSLVGRVTTVLQRRDKGTLAERDVAAELAQAAPELTAAQVSVIAPMPLLRWTRVAQAGETVLDATQAGEVREDQIATVRQQVRQQVTNDLAPQDRELAGGLAAAYVRPNSTFSADQTDTARQRARNSVDPVVVEVQQGQAVVRTGDPITQLTLEKLNELGLTRPQTELTTVAAYALFAALIAVLIVGFLLRFEPRVWHRNRSLLLFSLALLASAVALRISADRSLWAFVVPTSAAVLLVGILLDGYAGAAMAASLAVVAGLVNRDGFEPSIYVLAGGMISLLAIVRAERLNVFFRAGVLLALTNVGIVAAFSILQQRDLAAVLQLLAAAAVNAGLSVLLAVGSFAMLGNLFGIMTVFQLLELANPSATLLRRLLLETPGTYHHSVMVGNLAERAAETIGADPLLARVAAYYHDIGKTKNPLAFIENQAGSHNIHDDVSAETSARIIAAHIRDGIDLGYEHGLPVQIIGYIPQHHGTSVMSYFYGKALAEVGGNTELVDKNLYRYPGPKPQSREAAILMLADGVEASVRSLDAKDESSIRAMVERIVEARVEDGQLDDADLTLKNLTQIREAFVAQLLGMYHQRIKYPDNVVPLERREQA